MGNNVPTQKSRWDDQGVEPPAGEARYQAGEQPIAEYDNWFNKAVVDDIAAIITFLKNLGLTKIYQDLEENKPASGKTTELFIATDTNKIYRGTGDGWQELSIDLSQIIVNSDFLPDADGIRDIGASSLRWRDGYISGKLGIGVSSIEANFLHTPYNCSGNKPSVLIGSYSDLGNNWFALSIGIPSDSGWWPFGITKAGIPVFRIDTNGCIANSLIPTNDATYDIGSSTNRWKDGYFSGKIITSAYVKAVNGFYFTHHWEWPNNQGGLIGWNYPVGTGATCFFNHHGAGHTEFIFYSTTDWSNFTKLVEIKNSYVKFYIPIRFSDNTEISSVNDIEGGITYSTPTVYLGNGESLQLARFTLPTEKSFKVLKAQVAKSDGSSVSGLVIEVYDATNGTTVYSTSSATVVEGSPLATSNAGVEIIIRIKNSTGAAVDCQGFVVGKIS